MWFANDKQSEIIKIYDISEDKKHDEYRCPICSGLLRPRQGEIKQWHFSHMNAEDCSAEAFTHFWVKHELLKKGEPFKIKINGEIKEYICKDTLIEHEYNTSNGTYKPDLTIITENGEEIYFEIANTNKKKAKDYLNLWKELNNTVVEVSIKEMAGEEKIDIFNAIYWDGKIFREQVKDLRSFVDVEVKRTKYDEKKIEKIYWLIDDICKYNNNELDIDIISDEIQIVEDEEARKLVVELLRRKCSNIMEDYIQYNKKKTLKNGKDIITNIKIPRLIYDRIYGEYKVDSSIPNLSYINICKSKESIEKIIKKNHQRVINKIKNNILKNKLKLKISDDNYDILINENMNENMNKNIYYKNKTLIGSYVFSEEKCINIINEHIQTMKYKRFYIKKIINKINKELTSNIDKKQLILTIDEHYVNYKYKNEIEYSYFYYNSIVDLYNNKDNLFDDLINTLQDEVIKYEKYIELKHAFEQIINNLNERFKNYVYRKPKLNIIWNSNLLSVSIECRDKRGFLYNKKIGEFEINKDFKLNDIEINSCKIIREYKYKN